MGPGTEHEGERYVNSNLEQLHIQADPEGAPGVLRLEGELDPHTAPLLEREVAALTERGQIDLVLDLSGLQFIDSSGLRVLIAAHRELTALGGSLALRSPSETAQRLLEITGLVDHITIVGG
jgi:anti-sigma B factor antagonist